MRSAVVGLGDLGWGDAIAAAVIPGGIPAVAAYEALQSPPSKTDWNTIAIIVGAGAAALLVFLLATSKR